MSDKERVVEGLKNLEEHYYRIYKSELDKEACSRFHDRMDLVSDAINLIEGYKPMNYNDVWLCGQCRYAIHRKMNFCPNCGHEILWGEQDASQT